MSRNILALGADYALFLVALSFASPATILPAFAVYLGAPNVAVGAISAVMTLGWFLPSLFAAAHTEALSRKLPFVLRHTVWERVPFLVLALAAFLIADRAPRLTLVVLFAMLFVMTAVGGILMPAWMDIVGRSVPVTLRGRFFAVSNLGAGVAGFAGSFLTAEILGKLREPASYGVCFLCATVCMGLSYVALALVREAGGGAPKPRVALRAQMRRVPEILSGDPNFRWFLASRALAIAGWAATGFYTVYALRVWHAPAATAGVYTSLFLAGQIAGNVVLGWLADRMGHRVVIIAGVAATIVANGLALTATSLDQFGAVFLLVGAQTAAVGISNLSVLLEFAPAPADHPTFIGLGTTLMAPFVLGMPLLAGVLADALGFPAMFLAAAAAGAASLAVLVGRVRDPRHASR